MLISEKILEKVFTSEKMKDAYLSACKWVSSNIIAVNNFKGVTIKYEKVENKQSSLKQIKVTLYVTTDEKEILDRTCNICNECNKLFYMAENKNKCEACKIEPFRKREQEKLKNIKEGLKGKIL